MKIPQKPKGINQVKFGFLGGLIVPLIAGLFFYLSRYSNSTFTEFLNKLVDANIHTHVLSLSVLPNLLLFFIFIWTDKLFAARGVIGVTFLYAFAAYAIKFGM